MIINDLFYRVSNFKNSFQICIIYMGNWVWRESNNYHTLNRILLVTDLQIHTRTFTKYISIQPPLGLSIIKDIDERRGGEDIDGQMNLWRYTNLNLQEPWSRSQSPHTGLL